MKSLPAWMQFGVAAIFGLLVYLYFPLPPPNLPRAAPGDCVILHLWSNGFHSDLGVPAYALPPDHPLRRLYPQADSILIGWGDDAFYHSDDSTPFLPRLLMGIDALIPPSPSVMHVVAGAEAGAGYLGATADVRFAVSREGAASLARYLRNELSLDSQGRVEIVSPGKVMWSSVFVRSPESFHLFNVCNQWMARALRAAGLDVNARDKWMGGGLVTEVRRAAPATCPAS